MPNNSDTKTKTARNGDPDEGQRYEVTYYDHTDNQRHIYGYTDDLEEAQHMKQRIFNHATWIIPEMRDRKVDDWDCGCREGAEDLCVSITCPRK